MGSTSACMSTSTVTHTGQLVPWLAADGPLAYSPEEPPGRDYYFQYNWVLPGILADGTNKRRHCYFGAYRKEDATELLSFWEAARGGMVHQIIYRPGSIDAEVVAAPVAIYAALSTWRGPAYLLVQHGSYQFVQVEDQPQLESGEVLLYRGIQRATKFGFLRLGEFNAVRRELWQHYTAVQAHVLSDATRSFNSIHDRAKRCETEHIRDRSWMTDDFARANGLDIDSDGFAKELWKATHQSFSLARWVAENKFGPNYVVCKTHLANIRLTTFFAGENEVRIIDPRRVEVVAAHGCRV